MSIFHGFFNCAVERNTLKISFFACRDSCLYFCAAFLHEFCMKTALRAKSLHYNSRTLINYYRHLQLPFLRILTLSQMILSHFQQEFSLLLPRLFLSF